MTFFAQPSADLLTVSAMSTQPPSEDPTQQYNPQQGGEAPQGGGSNPWPWVRADELKPADWSRTI